MKKFALIIAITLIFTACGGGGGGGGSSGPGPQPSSAKAITAFSFASPSVSGTINEGAKTISVIVPAGTDKTNLTPAVRHTGVSYAPTGAQNFTSPVTYTVTAENGTTQNYTVTVTDQNTVIQPAATPPAGTYTAAQSVTLATTTAGASIYYTTNGATPTASSTLYSSAIAISATTTLKAIAVKSGMNNSDILTANYTINIPANTPTHDFTQQYQLLGLTRGTSVIADMDQRWNNAQTIDDGYKFYPTLTHTVTGINVDGETLSGNGIYGMSPEMIFLIKGTKLTIWGKHDQSAVTVSISYDIAIIKNSDSKGWLWQGTGGTAYKTEYYPDSSAGHTISYTLSGLTGGIVNTASDLGTNYANYSVYIIVRSTSLRDFFGDFNSPSVVNQLNTRNVIKPVIKL